MWLFVAGCGAAYVITALAARNMRLGSTKDWAPHSQHTMGVPFDFAPERPEHIDQILNGLDRYNPETTAVFQDYVMQQCESQTYDCYANLALLKLYVEQPLPMSWSVA